MQAFWRNLRCYDIVNVSHGDAPVPRKAMVEEIHAKTIAVRFEDDGSLAEIDPLSVRQRFRLPWQPKDLHDYLIVFRRQIPNRPGESIDDLRVRRNFVSRLLRLFTRQGTWREHCGTQPMHQYYTSCDFRSAAEMEELFPEDDVPEDLHFRDLHDPEASASLSCGEFAEWLRWGNGSCEVAQVLLHI